MKKKEQRLQEKKREKGIIGKWESGERERGNTNEKKEKTEKNGKEEKIKRSQNEKQRTKNMECKKKIVSLRKDRKQEKRKR